MIKWLNAYYEFPSLWALEGNILIALPFRSCIYTYERFLKSFLHLILIRMKLTTILVFILLWLSNPKHVYTLYIDTSAILGAFKNCKGFQQNIARGMKNRLFSWFLQVSFVLLQIALKAMYRNVFEFKEIKRMD